jgi:hypothetical protein
LVRLNVLAAALALSLAARGASAAGPARPYLRYVAPEECPGVDEYLQRVEQRLGSNWESALVDFAARLEVTLTERQGRYDGSVEFVTTQGERFTRSVSGRFCAEVVEGISLMTALAVRSRGGSDGTEKPVAHPSPDPSDSQVRAPAPEIALAPSPASDLTPRTASKPREAKHLRLRAGARVFVSTGIGPDAALGVGAFSALELGKSVIAIGADVASANNVESKDTHADFRLTTFRLEACPWAIGVSHWATIEPCLLGELGAFRAAARVAPPRVTLSEPATVSWGAIGAVARLVLHFRPGFAEVGVFARAPLRRERFYVEAEDQVVFRIPAVSGGAHTALGLEF